MTAANGMLWICSFVLIAAVASAQEQLAGNDLNFFSEAKEAALGAQMAKQIRVEKKMLGSGRAQEYVARLGSILAPHLPGYGPGYRFELFAGPASRLRAPDGIPGGYIFVPAGLFDAAETEAEFAGMLAHSMAHVAARQATSMATRGEVANLSKIPLIFMGGWTAVHGTDAMLPVPIGLLPYMREYELEADRLAVSAMAQAGYDPAALVRYIGRMQRELPERLKQLAELRSAIARLPALEYPADTGEYQKIREELRALVKVELSSPVQMRPPTLRR